MTTESQAGALFINLEYFGKIEEEVGNYRVLRFPSEQAAVDYAVDVLIKCDYADPTPDGKFRIGGCLFDSSAELLEGFQDGLGVSEYFHVWPCSDGPARLSP